MQLPSRLLAVPCAVALATVMAGAGPGFAENAEDARGAEGAESSGDREDSAEGGGGLQVDAAVAVGGGQRGDETYVGVEARLDLRWKQLRVGLAARGQWDDGVWRREDFTTAAGLGAAVRYLEWWYRGAGRGAEGPVELAVALGALRPAPLGHVSDGVQAAVDDRYHTGLRARGGAGALEGSLELDDVFAPQLLAGEVAWRSPVWRATVAAAVGASPWGEGGALAGSGGDRARATDEIDSALELSLARRFIAAAGERDSSSAAAGAPLDEARLGLGLIGEPTDGAHAVAFAELAAAVVPGWRVRVRGDARFGTGSLGLRFGPLYRLERLARGLAMREGDGGDGGEGVGGSDDDDAGFGGGLALRLERQGAGWLEAAVRARQFRRSAFTAHAGVPITSRAQAGAWFAADGDHVLLASEVRAFGRAGSFAAVEVSRLLRDHRMAEAEPAGDQSGLSVRAADAAATSAIDAALGWAVIAWVGIGR